MALGCVVSVASCDGGGDTVLDKVGVAEPPLPVGALLTLELEVAEEEAAGMLAVRAAEAEPLPLGHKGVGVAVLVASPGSEEEPLALPLELCERSGVAELAGEVEAVPSGVSLGLCVGPAVSLGGALGVRKVDTLPEAKDEAVSLEVGEKVTPPLRVAASGECEVATVTDGEEVPEASVDEVGVVLEEALPLPPPASTTAVPVGGAHDGVALTEGLAVVLTVAALTEMLGAGDAVLVSLAPKRLLDA